MLQVRDFFDRYVRGAATRSSTTTRHAALWIATPGVSTAAVLTSCRHNL